MDYWIILDLWIILTISFPFLSLDRVRILAVYGRVKEILECIKNILICVPKMNEGLTGLERHEGE